MGKYAKTIQIVILAAVLLIGGLTLGGAFFKNSTAIPRTGDKAPEFTAQGLDGKAYKLSDLRGRPVVLNFWGSFCAPCRTEMPDLQKQADKWGPSGVAFIGMNLGENAVTVQSFIDQYHIRFPVYLDENETVRKAYGVQQYPTTFFIRPDGKIVVIKVGMMDEAYIDQTVTAMLAAAK